MDEEMMTNTYRYVSINGVLSFHIKVRGYDKRNVMLKLPEKIFYYINYFIER